MMLAGGRGKVLFGVSRKANYFSSWCKLECIRIEGLSLCFLLLPLCFIITYPQSNVALNTVSIKKGTHSDSWPWPVELSYGKITIHTSLLSEHDQQLLMGLVGGQVMKVLLVLAKILFFVTILCTQRSSTLKTISSRSSMFRNAYPARMMRKTSAPIMRAHHWGFMSLRPIPPLSSQQLMSLKEVCVYEIKLFDYYYCCLLQRDAVKSPKAAKKFIYQGHKKSMQRFCFFTYFHIHLC